jgi:pilus assembly protein CpaD
MTLRPLLLASSLLLAGCMGTENRGLESVHQPVVNHADYALDVQVAGGALASGEDARLAGWFDAMHLGYGDRVALDDPQREADGARAQIGGVVAGYGLLVADEAPVTATAVQPGTVRVVVTRFVADVPGCPDWSRDSSYEFESNTSSNFGCATNSNLAAMVANPADLVRGRAGAGLSDPATSTRAIEIYRKAAPTGQGGTALQAQTQSSGGH